MCGHGFLLGNLCTSEAKNKQGALSAGAKTEGLYRNLSLLLSHCGRNANAMR